ncbi:MAG: 16S rRNA processing protein RimM [Deltaproteobacteria bacterium]|nr:16S rRNA processing protein RimM [Deltaproteobacteria bacterium]
MNKDIIPVGKIIGLHGIKGEVKVFPYGDLDDFEWSTILITGKGEPLSINVKRARKQRESLIFELEGISTRNDAEVLVGLEISVPKDELPELDEDEYYYFDLVGMEVWTDDGKSLGRIKNVISTGSNDVLEVSGPLGEVLIPALENIVLEVDELNRKVTVKLLEGLLPGETEQ